MADVDSVAVAMPASDAGLVLSGSSAITCNTQKTIIRGVLGNEIIASEEFVSTQDIDFPLQHISNASKQEIRLQTMERCEHSLIHIFFYWIACAPAQKSFCVVL